MDTIHRHDSDFISVSAPVCMCLILHNSIVSSHVQIHVSTNTVTIQKVRAQRSLHPTFLYHRKHPPFPIFFHNKRKPKKIVRAITS